MSNGMPTMPSVNSEETSNLLLGEVATPSETVKQEYIKPEDNVSSKVEIPLVPKTGIKVIATRKGFYGQMRIALGQKFTVKKTEQLGEWMKCEDPVLERERVKKFKDKKAKK